jgi:2-polyprenyl-3-methyl-5-hydroxy-6-metoxy-1,4-benzoquinol methylase
LFAGRVLPEPIFGGWLNLCRACGSMFRHPLLPWNVYSRLYQDGDALLWRGPSDRCDLAAVRSILAAEKPSGRVLDVGCASGDFLASLSPAHSKHGVEPSVAAAAVAAERGVSVLAPTLAELPTNARFDVITLIDVIEHLPEPAAVLESAYEHLLPGGLMIVSTGDPENAPWRKIFRSRFWYCTYPEHLSFPSLRFLQSWARNSHAQLLQKRTIRYQRLSLWIAALAATMQAAYLVSPSVFNWAARRFVPMLGLSARSTAPRQRCFPPSVPGLFMDHQVIVIARPLATRFPAS